MAAESKASEAAVPRLATLGAHSEGSENSADDAARSPRRDLSIKIGNLPEGKVDADLLRDVLRGFGTIVSIEIKPTLGSNDIAFAEFANEDELRAALDASLSTEGISIRARLLGGTDAEPPLKLEITRRRARLAQRRLQVTKDAVLNIARDSSTAICSCSLTRDKFRAATLRYCKRCNWEFAGNDLSLPESIDWIAVRLTDPENNHVVGLSLRGCQVGGPALARVGALLKANPRLRRLDLSENMLMKGALRAEAAKPYLEEDYARDTSGVHALCGALRVCSEAMRKLSVRYCGLELVEVRTIAFALIDHTGQKPVTEFELDAELNFIDDGDKEYFTTLLERQGMGVFASLLV